MRECNYESEMEQGRLMNHAAEESRTPVSVITGFLGSGKTTLLNALLKHPRMTETAVLVNEFGEIGIDHLLFETLDDDVLLLAAGCLCCTIREDMVASLRSLFERRADGQVPQFRRVVIETTGLADPAPILHTLLAGESAPAPWVVDGIVTTVDAVNGNRQLSAYSESVKQAAVADRLLVTKTDVARPHELTTLRERLRAINPGAPLLTACHGAIDPDDLFDAGPLAARGGRHPDVSGWLGDAAVAHGRHHHGAGSHDEGVRALCLSADAPIEIYRFVRWVEKLLEESGDRILRVKGILDVAGDPQPVVVHGVQHIFHPLERLAAWPDSDRGSRLVVIVKDLDIHRIEREFRDLVTPDAAG